MDEIQYANELTPQVIETLKQPRFSDDQLAALSATSAELAQRIKHQQMNTPKPVAIYRIATEGAVTRNGGVIRHGSSKLEHFCHDRLVRRALVGDTVVYPDGKTATIITGSGSAMKEGGVSVAVVGSKLDNGDEIISTPSDIPMLVEWENAPMPNDFLTNT